MLSIDERNWILVKNQYEGYEYIDPNHQYTYPNSTVLINKQNITNIEEAYRNEHLFVTRRLADLRLTNMFWFPYFFIDRTIIPTHNSSTSNYVYICDIFTFRYMFSISYVLKKDVENVKKSLLILCIIAPTLKFVR